MDCWNEEFISCAVVTTKAAKSVEPIHSRMPVLLDLTGAEQWLDTAAELNDLYPLFANKLPYELLARPVQQGINNSRNKELL
ncbi:MAG: SOS response-associated peptidase family protein [Candidatus Reddybacter sp.]